MIEKSKINTLFESFASQKVIVIGDVMLDHYIFGKVERISPEAPVPVLSNTKREARLGGAANVVLNLHALGVDTWLFGIISDDEKGGIFRELMEKQKLTTKGLISDNNRQTTVKTRIISNNHHLLRVDDESTGKVNEKIQAKLTDQIISALEKEDINAVIFEDYDKGVITPGLINKVVNKANELNIKTFVDPKKNNYDEYKGVTLFKPNFKEFKEGLHLDIEKGDIKELFRVGKAFIKKQGIENLLITLAEDGIFSCNEKSYESVPALDKLDVSDVSGAGDTVIAVAALCLAAGLSLKETAWIANSAGGLVCEKAGVVPVDKEELIRVLLKEQ